MNLPFSTTSVATMLGTTARLAALALATVASSARGGDICTAESLAAASGWHLNWVVQLPFDTDRTQLESLTISDDLVVATTGDGRVHAYHEGSSPLAGTLSWSHRIGHATEPGLPAQIGPSLVLATRGSNVYGFDLASGDRLWADRLGRMPNAAAVEGDNWVYVPYGPLRILRITAYPNGKTPPMSENPENAGTAAIEAIATARRARQRASRENQNPLLLKSGTSLAKTIHRLAPFSVGWIGEEGMLFTLNDLENGWKRHELRLGSKAAGDLIHRDNAIWLALLSGDVVKITSSPSQGLDVIWRAPLPAIPSGELLVDGDTLLVSLGTWGVEARSATTGDLLWKRDQPVRFLAAGGGRAWWFDEVGRLTLVDLSNGSAVARLRPGRFQMPIVNSVNDRLYLATHDGVVASLAPTAIVEEEVPAPPAPKPIQSQNTNAEPNSDDNLFRKSNEENDPFPSPPTPKDDPGSDDPFNDLFGKAS